MGIRYAANIAAAAFLVGAAASAADLSPWQAAGDGVAVRAANGGFVLSLECSQAHGFSADVSSNDIGYHARVRSVLLKVADQGAVRVPFDQDEGLPAMIKLRDVDALEKSILAKGAVEMKLSAEGREDVVADYRFGDLKTTRAAILKMCPPF